MAFTTFDNYVGYVSTTGTQPQLDALDKLISQEKAWDPSTTDIMNKWGNLAWDKDLDPKTQGPLYITYGNALNALKTYPQKLDYLTSLYNVSDAKIKDDFAKSAGKYLYDTNPPGLTGAEKQAYTPANYTDIVTGKATGTLKKNILDARVEAGKQAILNSTPYSNGLNDSQLTAKATALVNGTPTSSMADFNTFKDSYLDAVGRPSYTPTADWNKNLSKLKTDYGSLIDPTTGKAKFSESYLTDVAKGIAPADDFNKTINSLVNDAVRVSDPSLFAKGVQPNLQGSEYVAARNALLKSPASLTSSYNTNVVGATKDPKTNTWAIPSKNTDIDTPSDTSKDTSTNFAYNGGISNLLGSNGQIDPTKLNNMLSSYDSNAGTYRSPTVQNGRATFDSSTPYSSILNSLLTTTTNPFASDYKSSVALPSAMSDSQLTAIKKTANVNTTPADLLKLANTAGQTYDPKAVTSLSSALTQMYQPVTNTKADGTQYTAKPGAPDLTKTTIPTLTSDGTGIINSNGTVTKIDNTNTTPKDWWYTRGFASEAQANANGWFNDVKKVSDDPGKVVDPWTELGITQAQYEAGQKSFADARLLAANARLSHYDADKTVADKLGITKDQYANDQSAYTKVRNAASPPVTPGPWTELGITQAQYEAGQKSFADARAKGDAARAATATPGPWTELGITQAQYEAGQKSFADAKAKGDAARQAGLVALANQQAIDKAAAEQKAIEDARLAALARNPDGGPSSLAPINPSNGGSSSAITISPNPAQNNLGPLNISSLGAVISPQAMNSTAGGVASLVSPQVTVQPQPAAGTSTVLAPNPSQTQQAIQPAVTQKPAVIGDPWDNMGISQQDYYENYY